MQGPWQDGETGAGDGHFSAHGPLSGPISSSTKWGRWVFLSGAGPESDYYFDGFNECFSHKWPGWLETHSLVLIPTYMVRSTHGPNEGPSFSDG